MTLNKLSAILLTLILLLFKHNVQAQQHQRIRGNVSDAQLKSPLEGATVLLDGGKQKSITGSDGNFSFGQVPLGIHYITVSYTGYSGRTFDNLSLNAGKELVLNLGLEPSLEEEAQVVVTAKSKKNRPVNDMSVVSARAFTVEETQRYAAAVNDPLRMATAYAGVVSAEDGGNDIVIRGNSPAGLIWRMEGVDIPNPNHFSSAGSSGGGISILSTQLLANSDFITGAFAAEYGNGLSGVFDLHLRKGNNKKGEYSAQLGVLGLNLGAEGPLFPFYKGSYLVNYRLSSLQLLDKLGVAVGPGTTDFQDLSFHVHLPTAKWGSFSFFGFGGLSRSKVKAEDDPAKWEDEWKRYHSDYIANTGMGGLKHELLLGKKTRLETTLSYSATDNGSELQYVEDDKSNSLYHKDAYVNTKLALASLIQHRVSPQHLFKGGVRLQRLGFSFDQQTRDNPGAPLEQVILEEGNTMLLQAHAQWQFRPTNKLTLLSGLHYMHLLLNDTWIAEPRAAIQFQADAKNTVSIGYGLHSQVQPLGVYYVKQEDAGGAMRNVNRDLDLSKAHHLVLSWQRQLGNNWKTRAELYYQHLFDVPVSMYDTSSFSMLNVRGDYVAEPLVNEGKGANYGLELSLEKHLTNGFYGMLSTSFYQSKYKAKNGLEHNTRFNGKQAFSLVAGKEWVRANNKKVWGLNTRVLQNGGYWNTPVNLEQSIANDYAVYYEDQAYSIQNPAYFRIDIRASLQWNYKNCAATLSLDLQNATNRQNVFMQVYDRQTASIKTAYQTGVIPVLNYKVEF